ncbi:aminotransferase family protein-like protein [Xylariomycetidae sp. FL0641]|nr:aminotransferase family protein-like protein [Xylariomycetidae sp. FL0641]
MTPFGKPMREAHFDFASTYTPLNHGSFGAYPSTVRAYQQALRHEREARPDTFVRFTYPKLLDEARAAVAPLLGAACEEVVFVPNALTGINTILRNLTYEDGDVILHFSTIYGACLKTIQSLEETTPVRGFSIPLLYPVEDSDIVDLFCTAILVIRLQGKRVKLAMFDTILSFPGVRFPWELLVGVCQQHGILSCVDGAHGIGHIDLTHLRQVDPDFFVSNCYKWFMVPSGCTVLYVPVRNHHVIKTTFPTAEGYLPAAERSSITPTEYFQRLFEKVSTVDTSPYVCVLEALKFRSQVCGGEANVREYCHSLAREGGKTMADIMQTQVLDNQTGTLRDCCFTNVKLPLEVDQARTTVGEQARTIAGEQCRKRGSVIAPEDATAVADWITIQSVNEFDSFLATRYYAGAFWVRLSAQIYLDVEDFRWAASVLLDLCERAKMGEWKPGEHDDE